jgi:hypothetical protein
MTETNKKPVFRYTYSVEFIEELRSFANHAKDQNKMHRHDFKEAWKCYWESTPRITAKMEEEIERLAKLGQPTNETRDKMYKSARYYFSKQGEDDGEEKPKEDQEKKTKKPKYKGFSKDFLAQIDRHIQNAALQEDQKNKSPATLYDDFCKTQKDAIMKEIVQMKNKELDQALDPQVFSNKCKKTYKNRYYVIKT